MSEMDEDEVVVKEARDAAKALKELREHPGWLIIKAFIEEQVKNRIDHYVLQPRTDMKSEWEKEFMKGEVAGMRMVLSLVDSELETQEAIKDAIDARRHASAGRPQDDDGDDEPSFDRFAPAEHGWVSR